MMNSVETISDAALVSESLAGDRDAFGRIVARYQTLVCSLAYSRTGSLSQSEDLAQETFLAAWQQLARLREPHKLRPWLCGIARNLIFDALKKQGREPSHAAESLDAAHEAPAPELPPPDRAMNAEEQAILWRAIGRIPETYRDPLILFYREHQSIGSVAASLELSEEAVKQRLSRGRKLLHEQVLAYVEGALASTSPGPAFTFGVLAGLPVMTFSAKAAALGAAAKGGAAVKSTLLGAGLGWLLGPMLGVLCGILGIRNGLRAARTPRERSFILRHLKIIVGIVVAFTACLLSLNFLKPSTFRNHTALIVALGLGVVLGYAILVLAVSLRFNRRFARLRAEEEQAHPELPRRPALAGFQFGAVWEYRSRATFLGLPLVHCRGGRQPGQKIQPAVGWIAFGEVALGILFASGGVAAGAVSMGGLSVGLFSVGGFGLGLFAFGGLALGAAAMGGASVGLVATGGIALGWHAALGGMAVARDLACGGAASATHVNDDVARAFFVRHPWLDITHPASNALFWLLCFGPTFLQLLFWNWWRRKLARRVSSDI